MAGLDLLAERERGDGASVDGADDLGDHVAVFFGRDPEKVGHRRLRPEDAGHLLEGDQLAQLRRPPDLPGLLTAGQVACDTYRARLDVEGAGQVIVGGHANCLARAAGVNA